VAVTLIDPPVSDWAHAAGVIKLKARVAMAETLRYSKRHRWGASQIWIVHSEPPFEVQQISGGDRLTVSRPQESLMCWSVSATKDNV